MSKHQIDQSDSVWSMSGLTRDRTAEPVSRDQTLGRERGQGNIHFRCPAGYEQDWQPHPVDAQSALCDDFTYLHMFLRSIVLRYAGAPIATRVSFIFFLLISWRRRFFQVFFVPLPFRYSLYGEYVVRYFLPDGVFLPFL